MSQLGPCDPDLKSTPSRDEEKLTDAESQELVQALLTLARDYGVPPDVQEVLILGNPLTKTKPGALIGLLRRHRSPSATQEWRPIETAPKDGTRVLIATPIEGSPSIVLSAWWAACFEAKGFKGTETIWRGAWTDGSVKSWGYEEMAEYKPTKWQPLPEPPK